MNAAPREPYAALNQCLRARFGMKVQRIALSLHAPCPNRAEGRTGCVFCLPESYAPSAAAAEGGVRAQLLRGIAHHAARGSAQGFIAYLQTGSNTCGPPASLRAVYTEALSVPGVLALSIATRPDCLPDDVLALLDELAAQHEIWVELGVQSMHNRTLQALQRGHDAACSQRAVTALLATRVQHVVAHMILGLPGESEAAMHASMRMLYAPHAAAPPRGPFPRLGVKLHHLQVMANTPLEQPWRAGGIPTLELDDYARLVVDVLEHLPPEIVVHRVCGAAAARYLCAPVWPGTRAQHVARIRQEFSARATWQGRLWAP